MNARALLLARFLLLCLLMPATAAAQVNSVHSDEALRLDIEVDPIAYALGGYSVHGGIRHGNLRFDIGAFAASVPEGFHGHEGVEVRSGGFGVKVDYKPFDFAPGLLLGASMNLVRDDLRNLDTGVATDGQHLSVGGRVGYQIDLAGGFYLLPWVGVDAYLTDRTTDVGDARYEPGRVMLFPTVHLGYVN